MHSDVTQEEKNDIGGSEQPRTKEEIDRLLMPPPPTLPRGVREKFGIVAPQTKSTRFIIHPPMSSKSFTERQSVEDHHSHSEELSGEKSEEAADKESIFAAFLSEIEDYATVDPTASSSQRQSNNTSYQNQEVLSEIAQVDQGQTTTNALDNNEMGVHKLPDQRLPPSYFINFGDDPQMAFVEKVSGVDDRSCEMVNDEHQLDAPLPGKKESFVADPSAEPTAKSEIKERMNSEVKNDDDIYKTEMANDEKFLRDPEGRSSEKGGFWQKKKIGERFDNNESGDKALLARTDTENNSAGRSVSSSEVAAQFYKQLAAANEGGVAGSLADGDEVDGKIEGTSLSNSEVYGDVSTVVVKKTELFQSNIASDKVHNPAETFSPSVPKQTMEEKIKVLMMETESIEQHCNPLLEYEAHKKLEDLGLDMETIRATSNLRLRERDNKKSLSLPVNILGGAYEDQSDDEEEDRRSEEAKSSTENVRIVSVDDQSKRHEDINEDRKGKRRRPSSERHCVPADKLVRRHRCDYCGASVRHQRPSRVKVAKRL